MVNDHNPCQNLRGYSHYWQNLFGIMVWIIDYIHQNYGIKSLIYAPMAKFQLV